MRTVVLPAQGLAAPILGHLTTVTGYYIHHHGHGHLHRAETIARAVAGTRGAEMTGLSSRTRSTGWVGPWVRLADDADPVPEKTDNATAFGRLHHVPTGHSGLRDRSAAVSAWIAATAPRALVVDVSVEIALLARLHGIPVVSMGMPGFRHDKAHDIGYGVSDLVLGPWPAGATRWLHGGAPDDRLVAVGAISRFTPVDAPVEIRSGTAVVINGTGGDPTDPATLTVALVAAADRQTAGWSLEYLAGGGHWVDDPWSRMHTAEVVVSHCGQNAVAEIAASRRPAVLVPATRPFDEQWATARALREMGLPALVLDRWPAPEDWSDVLTRAAALDGADWVRWNDGQGAERAAELIGTVSGATMVATGGRRWTGSGPQPVGRAHVGRDHDARIA